jgi:type VI secretion system secreted protein Hcp
MVLSRIAAPAARGEVPMGLVDMFLKLDGIKGEALDAKYKDQIDLLRFSWGAEQTGTTHKGAGSGGGRVAVKDIVVHKFIDFASPTLFIKCCTGTHIQEGEITMRKAGGDKPVEFLKLKLTAVLIANVELEGEESEPGARESGKSTRHVNEVSAGQFVREKVTLNFRAFRYVYTKQNADGSAGTSNDIGFDIAENTAK